MADFYDWKESRVACSACPWVGLGRDAQMGDSFESGAEYHCPSCGAYFGFKAYPTYAEARSDPRADPADRMAADIALTRIEQFERTKPVDPSQLPDLDPAPVSLLWDVDGDPGAGFVVILDADREIWRETSWFENVDRFEQIAATLQSKYGPVLRDLVPTRRSQRDLWGDKLAAPDRVMKVRTALRRGEPLPRSTPR